jgi:hypothetical protein
MPDNWNLTDLIMIGSFWDKTDWKKDETGIQAKISSELHILVYGKTTSDGRQNNTGLSATSCASEQNETDLSSVVTTHPKLLKNYTEFKFKYDAKLIPLPTSTNSTDNSLRTSDPLSLYLLLYNKLKQ